MAGARGKQLVDPGTGAHAVATALAGWSDDRLATLLTARPDLAAPPPADFGDLAARAAAWPSIQACSATLDRCCVQLVEALCLLPAVTTIAELTALLGSGVRAEDLDDPLARLEDRALVLRDGGDLRLLPTLRQLRYPAGLGPPAGVLLNARTAAILAGIAGRLGVPAGRTKDATLAAVTRALADAGLVARLLRDGPKGTVELAARMGLEHATATVAGAMYAQTDRTPIGWLANRGMAVPVSWDRVVMPGEVGLALRGGRPFTDFTPRPPPLALVTVDAAAVDSSAAERALRLVADVAAILESWGEAPPRLLKAGGVGVRDLRKAAKAVERSEADAARVVELAGVAGLVAADWAEDVALPTAAFDEWMALDPASRWARLAAAWLRSGRSLGLAGAVDVKDKPIPPLLPRRAEPHAVERRRLVVEALGAGGPGHAVDTASLRARVHWDRPAVWAGGPASAELLVSWAAGEADLLGVAAMASLSTFGRLAAAGRFEEAGHALARHTPAMTATFVLQGDLTVVAPGELAAPVRAELDLLADVESKGAATVRRFSEVSLRRGFDAGRTSEEILAFLEAHATHGVPQPLAYLVADLGRRHGHARVGAAGSYVRSDDASLLAEVLRAKRTARLCLRQLAPTVLVSDADPATVVTTLQAAGYLPTRERSDGALVLARPQRRRAPAGTHADRLARLARGGGGEALFDELDELDELDGDHVAAAAPVPDPAAVVTRLRRAPPPPAPGSMPAAAAPAAAPPLPHFFDDDGHEDRPAAIAKGIHEVTALLVLASEEQWMVRIGYTNRSGRSTQMSVAPLEIEGRDLLAECVPGWDTRTLALSRVEWARVMTEAEEDALL